MSDRDTVDQSRTSTTTNPTNPTVNHDVEQPAIQQRTSRAEQREILRLRDVGLRVDLIAAQIKRPLSTVYAVLAKYEDHSALVLPYLKAKAADVVERWESATVEAVSKGNHKPMRDWLLHAGAIEPLAQTPLIQQQFIIQASPGLPSYASEPVQDGMSVTGVIDATPIESDT